MACGLTANVVLGAAPPHLLAVHVTGVGRVSVAHTAPMNRVGTYAMDFIDEALNSMDTLKSRTSVEGTLENILVRFSYFPPCFLYYGI